MEMRRAGWIGMCGLLVVAGLGCSKVSKDSSKVIATVGGEKITEKSFGDAVRILLGDDAKAQELLTNPSLREQRNQFLAQFVDQKIMVKYGEKQGLDKDPKAKMMLEAGKASAYRMVLMERNASKAEPTEEQLKAFYEEHAKRAKAAGQEANFPTYEAVKAQLPDAYKRQKIQDNLQKSVDQAEAQVVKTIDPDWRSAAPAK